MQPKYLLTILDLGLGPMTVAIRELSREQVEKILNYLNPVSGYSGFPTQSSHSYVGMDQATPGQSDCGSVGRIPRMPDQWECVVCKETKPQDDFATVTTCIKCYGEIAQS